MWLLFVLLIFLVFLLVLVIISTSMKIGLIITNRHNYESRLLIIPSILTIIIWGIAIFIFYLLSKDLFKNGFEDMLLTIFMAPSSIEFKKEILTNATIICFVTVLLQSFTYYAINIDYSRIFGYIRFKIKTLINYKEKNKKNSQKISIYEERFNVPLHIAVITSIFTFIFTCLIIFGLYKLGVTLSHKIINRI